MKSAEARYSALSDVEVLRRLLMLRRPGRALKLLHGGLMSFLWMEDLREQGFSSVCQRKIGAAQYMVCRFAGQAVGKEPLSSAPEPVVRFLFLKYSKPHEDVRGLLFLDEDGRGLGSYTLDRPCPERPTSEVRNALQAAVSSSAAYLVLFHIRPGGGPDATGEEAAFAERLRAPARALGLEIADTWVITGPARWRSLGPGSLPAGRLPGRGHFVGLREIPLSEVRERLDDLLYRGKWEGKDCGSLAPEVPAVRELVKDARALRELAATPPDELHHPGLSLQAKQALAAALELTQRLGQTELAHRALAGGPEWLARVNFPEFRHCTHKQVWLLGINAHHQTVWRQHVPTSTLQDSAELSRLVLRVALKHKVLRLVPLWFHPAAPPWDLAEKLASEVRKDLASVGVRCDDALALSADGSWAGQEQSGKLITEHDGSGGAPRARPTQSRHRADGAEHESKE